MADQPATTGRLQIEVTPYLHRMGEGELRRALWFR